MPTISLHRKGDPDRARFHDRLPRWANPRWARHGISRAHDCGQQVDRDRAGADHGGEAAGDCQLPSQRV